MYFDTKTEILEIFWCPTGLEFKNGSLMILLFFFIKKQKDTKNKHAIQEGYLGAISSKVLQLERND